MPGAIKKISVSLILSLLLFYFLLFLGFGEYTYTENNRIKYLFLTPSVLADAPRISTDYSFSISPDDNYGFERASVDFINVQDFEKKIKILQEYVDKQQLDDQSELMVSSHWSDESQISVVLYSYSYPRNKSL